MTENDGRSFGRMLIVDDDGFLLKVLNCRRCAALVRI